MRLISLANDAGLLLCPLTGATITGPADRPAQKRAPHRVCDQQQFVPAAHPSALQPCVDFGAAHPPSCFSAHTIMVSPLSDNSRAVHSTEEDSTPEVAEEEVADSRLEVEAQQAHLQ